MCFVQRKRVSVGHELLINPSVILLDGALLSTSSTQRGALRLRWYPDMPDKVGSAVNLAAAAWRRVANTLATLVHGSRPPIC